MADFAAAPTGGENAISRAAQTLSTPHQMADLERSVQQLALLLDVSRSLASELDLERLLASIMANTTKILDADRSTLFLVDYERDELWSRVAQGEGIAEIRIPRSAGIAGHVALTGETVNIPDAYADPRFNQEVDRRTGYRTNTILCMPVQDATGTILGVLQVLNRDGGPFSEHDERMLAALGAQAAVALTNASLMEARRKEAQKSNILLDVMRSVSSKLELDSLLVGIMAKTTEVMQADRSSLFLVDHKTNELWFKVAQGAELQEIRFPVGVGIAGHVAATGETINIVDAYDDPRFNQEVDRQTGYRTRTILCIPMKDADGTIVGVLQVLNKKNGLFTREDEDLLTAVASQEVIALRNAALFQDVTQMKNYNESVLRSMATGVVTIGMDRTISTANPAAERILGFEDGLPIGASFDEAIRSDANEALWEPVGRALANGEARQAQKIRYSIGGGGTVTVNVSAVPLRDHKVNQIGVVVVLEDISREQQLLSTLSRVVSRQVAEQLLESGSVLSLGGQRCQVTVLMSDIRDFTPLSESSEPEEIVAMLNDYFGRMIDVIFKYEGTLDKFIGDSIMAVYGTPIAHPDDPLRAVLSGIEMRQALRLFNEERRAQGKPAIEIGIGICDGEAVAGAIGSEERLELTVIGDTVNTAARLEGLTKEFPQHKLVFNQAVYEIVRDRLPCDFLAEEHVKGKSHAVKVYGISEAFVHSLNLSAIYREAL